MTSLSLESFQAQSARWPASERHVLAQYDDESVVVYQAYRPSIGRFAAENGFFGGDFSLSRMSWIKPNFLWMMYRCGWATKEGQEVVLAVWLAREAFDQILSLAVPSSYWDHRYPDRAAWEADVASSDVRLQWDPDHDPHGSPVTRRASPARTSRARSRELRKGLDSSHRRRHRIRSRAARSAEQRRSCGARDTSRGRVSVPPFFEGWG
jgi:hypothetical protein